MKIKARQIIAAVWLLLFCFECLGYGCGLSFDKSKEGQASWMNKELSLGLPLILEENAEDTDDKRTFEKSHQEHLIASGAFLPSSISSYSSNLSNDQNHFSAEQTILLLIGKLSL